MNTMVFDWIARRLVSGLHLNKFILEGFVWPNLDAAALDEAAFAAWSICVARPRSGLLDRERRSPPWLKEQKRSRKALDATSAGARLEVLVAQGLGLSHADLVDIYSYDRSDRRGFWRYFDAAPEGLDVTRRALAAKI